MHHILISVSKFCRSNKTSIEFFPSYFVIKDLRTGKPILQGKNKHDPHEWPNTGFSPPNFALALSTTVSTPASSNVWHRCLGHPLKIMESLGTLGLISVSSSISPDFFC